MNLDKNQEDLRVLSREPRVGSHSAPIFAEKKFDPAEKVRNMQPSAPRKPNTYVLPTPVDAKGSSSSRTSQVPRSRPSGPTHNLWHSSPLEDKKHEKDSGDGNLPGPTISKPQSVLKESNINTTSTPLPPPLAGGVSRPQLDTFNASDTKKIKRYAFSGPLISKPGSTKPLLSASGPIEPIELPHLVSGMPSRLPNPQPSSSPKVSPSASPPLVSSPRISELHELPRPPGNLASKAAKSPGLLGHSAPLIFRNQEHSAMNKFPLEASSAASPLPAPPFVSRSFSIPSSSQRAMAIHVGKLLDSPLAPDKAEDVASPPLTPISLSSIKPASTLNEMSSQSGQIRGE